MRRIAALRVYIASRREHDSCNVVGVNVSSSCYTTRYEMSICMLVHTSPSHFIDVDTGQQQQQCSIDSLPPFGDTTNDRPDRDRFQAIVPAYSFQCTGSYRVTEWMACVERHGSYAQYYIQFQVWRPNGPTGCYSLVDYNHPLDDAGMESYLVAINDDNSPLHRCVVLTVEEDEQIEVQSGDVVGYYVDHFRAGDNGIQWIEEDDDVDYIDDVVVYYEDDLPRESIKSHYGIGVNPTECDFVLPANADTTSYAISQSMMAAPIISFSIGKTIDNTSELQAFIEI